MLQLPAHQLFISITKFRAQPRTGIARRGGVLARVIIQRLALLILVVFGVSLITFLISHTVPGDPARLMAGPRASAETVDALRHELGLDRPLYAQYTSYVGQLLGGDFGKSIQTGRPVSDDLFRRFPATIELMLLALLTSVLIGVPLGIYSAVNKDRIGDHFVRFFSVLGISMPSFWLALLLMFLFYGLWDLLPASGRLGSAVDPPTRITGFYLVDSLLTGNFRVFGDAFVHLLLPTITLSVISIGSIVRLVRSSMLETLNENYILMARASGISRNRILYNHALRNAMIPLVTVLGLSLADMLYGAVVIETIFAWPGTGSYVVNAIFNLDFPVIMAFTVIVSMAYVIVNLLVDLAYMLLDPQIRAVG